MITDLFLNNGRFKLDKDRYIYRFHSDKEWIRIFNVNPNQDRKISTSHIKYNYDEKDLESKVIELQDYFKKLFPNKEVYDKFFRLITGFIFCNKEIQLYIYHCPKFPSDRNSITESGKDLHFLVNKTFSHLRIETHEHYTDEHPNTIRFESVFLPTVYAPTDLETQNDKYWYPDIYNRDFFLKHRSAFIYLIINYKNNMPDMQKIRLINYMANNEGSLFSSRSFPKDITNMINDILFHSLCM